jgi:hypothetical protein
MDEGENWIAERANRVNLRSFPLQKRTLNEMSISASYTAPPASIRFGCSA